MILIILLACSVLNYNAEARVTSVATGGGEGEFYVASDLYCGPLLFPKIRRRVWAPVSTEITHCETHEGKKGRPVVECDNVADTESMGWAVTELDRFSLTGSRVVCDYLVLFGPGGENSGWTPT